MFDPEKGIGRYRVPVVFRAIAFRVGKDGANLQMSFVHLLTNVVVI